jgi:hypothetical protein
VASYYGLAAIAARMEIRPATVTIWHKQLGFPMYPRRKDHRWRWFTTDALITTWEFRQSAQARKTPPQMRAERQSLKTRNGLDSRSAVVPKSPVQMPGQESESSPT